MKTTKFLVIALIAAFYMQSCVSAKYSVMTYNVRNCKGLDNNVDFNRTAGVITKYAPDFVALQELDSVTNRYGSRYTLKEIANLTAMNYAYASAINFGGGSYGVGLLSKEKPIRVIKIQLPGSEEQRVMLIAEFSNVIMCCTHFSLTAKDQLASIEIIKNALVKLDVKFKGNKPIIVAGDMNAAANSETQKQINVYFKNLSGAGNTFPANNPDRCLDYVYYFNPVRNNLVKSTDSMVINESEASDHRPVLVKLSIMK